MPPPTQAYAYGTDTVTVLGLVRGGGGGGHAVAGDRGVAIINCRYSET